MYTRINNTGSAAISFANIIRVGALELGEALQKVSSDEEKEGIIQVIETKAPKHVAPDTIAPPAEQPNFPEKKQRDIPLPADLIFEELKDTAEESNIGSAPSLEACVKQHSPEISESESGESNSGSDDVESDEVEPRLNVKMNEKEVVTPLLVPVEYDDKEEHKKKCECQCCGRRRERKDRHKKKAKSGSEKRKKREMSDLHKRLEMLKTDGKSESRGGMLRDVALGACAGGLGALVGIIVDRKQRRKAEKRKEDNHPYRPLAGVMEKMETRVAQFIPGSPHTPKPPAENVYKLSETPPTPPPHHVPPHPFATPLHPGWNMENALDRYHLEFSLSENLPLVPSLQAATIPLALPERRHRHRHHHSREHNRDEASTVAIKLPKDVLLGGGPTAGLKDGNVQLVLYSRDGKWTVVENGGDVQKPVDDMARSHYPIGNTATQRPNLKVNKEHALGGSTESTPRYIPKPGIFPPPPSERSQPTSTKPMVSSVARMLPLTEPLPPDPASQTPWQFGYDYTPPSTSPLQQAPRRVSFRNPFVISDEDESDILAGAGKEWWCNSGSGAETGGEGMGVVDPPLRRAL